MSTNGNISKNKNNCSYSASIYQSELTILQLLCCFNCNNLLFDNLCSWIIDLSVLTNKIQAKSSRNLGVHHSSYLWWIISLQSSLLLWQHPGCAAVCCLSAVVSVPRMNVLPPCFAWPASQIAISIQISSGQAPVFLSWAHLPFKWRAEAAAPFAEQKLHSSVTGGQTMKNFFALA